MIWDVIQTKMDNVGKVIDGKQDSMRVSSSHQMPDRGQAGIAHFMPQTSVTGARRPPPQQHKAGDEAGCVKVQSTIEKFFKGGQEVDCQRTTAASDRTRKRPGEGPEDGPQGTVKRQRLLG